MHSRLRTVCALLVSFSLFAAVGCTEPEEVKPPAPSGKPRASSGKGKVERKSLQHDGQQREYYVHVPVEHTGGEQWPVLILLHGAGGGTAKLPYDPVFNEYKCICVYPQGIDARWNDGRKENFRKKRGGYDPSYDDVGFMDKLIDQMIADYNVDPTRVYFAGMSNGGLMTLRLAMEMSHRIAAIGVATASLTPFTQKKKPEHPVPMILMNGTKDKITPYDGGEVMGRKGKILSTDETIAFYLELNDCAGVPVVEDMPDTNRRDRTTARKFSYGPKGKAAQVVLIKIDGGGHTWPGYPAGLYNLLVGRTSQDFSATEKVLEFCKPHSRPSAAKHVKRPVSN